MEEAAWNLLDKGEKIAKEAKALKEELTAALQEVRRESEYLEGRSSLPILRVLATAVDLWVFCFVLKA